VLPVVAANGQTPETLSFEVASVKPAGPDELAKKMPFMSAGMDEQMRMQGGPGTKDPDRIDSRGVTLKMLLKRAYHMLPDQISGPGWFDTERYEVSAKVPTGTTPEQFRLMLQNLLTERFQIRLHRETKTMPVYLLIVAKNGPKLQPPEKAPEFKDAEERRAATQKLFAASAAAMKTIRENGDLRSRESFHRPDSTSGMLADLLAPHLDRPVLDRTQLTGHYSVTLSWVVEDGKPSGGAPPGPTIFDAVEEQLGLKLQASNEQVELLVIDKAEKTAISN
jgi:uncharacterized protein (TIGR03435 family)